MRRIRRRESFQINLDSFLDILTNTIGALILIAVLVSLTSLHLVFRISTPVHRLTDKTHLVFECRENRLIPVDLVHYQSLFEDSQQVSEMEDNYYRVKRVADKLTLTGKRGGNVGETIVQARNPLSDFQFKLASGDAARQFVFFLVRPDSYDMYHVAKEIAKERQFDVGWEPFPEDKKITFGRGFRGRKLGLQ